MVIFNVAVRFMEDAPGTLHEMGDFQSPQQANEFLDTLMEAYVMDASIIVASSVRGVSIPRGEGFGAEG